MPEFADKTVLVTGAGSGIGRATARHFAAAGAGVIIADRDEAGGKETVRLIQADGGAAIFIHADVTDPEDVAHLFTQALHWRPRLDIAVNNAGIGGPWARTADYPLEGWRQVMAVNLDGVFFCLQHELRQMTGQGGGAVVNVASIAGQRGLPYQSAYTASKHGVIGLTRTAAQEYARYGIRVNAVCPVYTRTPLFEPMIQDNQRRAEKMLANIPLRRFAEPDEVADVILWLCS
ncbi:MAG: glucose 1-dehydrogenase, partial [Caldilineae bacterium]